MAKFILISLISLFTSFTYGQNKPSGFEISDKWTCVVYQDSIQLEMISYFKANFHCGTLIDNSLAICRDKKGDTLRVIELCPGPKDYKTGQLFTFATYKYITQDKKTYKKYFPDDESANEKFKYNHIEPTSFGRLQPINEKTLVTTADKIKIEIKDSLLFVNGDFVSKGSIPTYFKQKYGKPSRQKRGRKYKWKEFTYDNLGISIMNHPKSISLRFHYFRFIKSQPKKTFTGVIYINGHEIDPKLTFDELKTLLYPCRLDNIHNRSLLGTFFSFHRGLYHDKLSEVNYHFVLDPKDRIGQTYLE